MVPLCYKLMSGQHCGAQRASEHVDWFNSFKYIENGVGVIYIVIANLPRSQRYKIENTLIVHEYLPETTH